jgi:small GTP-binding protein
VTWTTSTTTSTPRRGPSPPEQRCACRRDAFVNSSSRYLSSSSSPFPEGIEILIDPRKGSGGNSKSRHGGKVSSSNTSTSIKFVDKMRMVAKGGDGGKGSLSLLPVARKHRLKPDGGHGGNGGSVVLVATPNLTSLNGLQHHLSGTKGGNGTSQICHGKAGKNTIVRVPCGVLVKSIRVVDSTRLDDGVDAVNNSIQDEEEEEISTTVSSSSSYKDDPGVEFVLFDSEEELEEFELQQQPHEHYGPSSVSSSASQRRLDNDDRRRGRTVLADLDQPGSYCVVTKGGRGGRGTAKYAGHHGPLPEPAVLIQGAQGHPGDLVHLELELKSIGDIGLVGFPNAGKSSTLAALSRASPKVAPYPFTTLHPIIGVVEYQDGFRIKMADIPGLVDGASNGRGQGLDFLRHIERTKALLYVVDASTPNGPVDDLRVLVKEMTSYDASLLSRPAVIAANKVDLLPAAASSTTIGDDDESDRKSLSELLRELGDAARDLGIQCDDRIVATSAGATGRGLRDLTAMLRAVVVMDEEEQEEEEQEEEQASGGQPSDSRSVKAGE